MEDPDTAPYCRTNGNTIEMVLTDNYLDEWDSMSHKTNHEYHWHKDHFSNDFVSIRMSDESHEPLGGYGSGWTVEIYPDPDKGSDSYDEMTRWHYSPQECEYPYMHAFLKVLELMKRHA